jgi:glycine/D-amino acid oxidase-like deaminating enzyme
VADVALAAFGPRDEGWFDNMGLRDGLRVAARASGAESVTAEVAGLARRADRVTALELADGRRIEAGTVVCAAGTGAAAILRLLGEDWPIEPRKRTVFVVDAPAARDPDAPLVVDHRGAYFRPEGAHWIAAVMPEADGPAAPDDFEPDLHQFEALLWPRLFARSESFAAARVVRAWAGHYAYNRLDQNAIVGRHPHCANLFLMNGFSGHGLQQAPAVGRGIAELVLHGGYRTLDLSPLAPDRVLTGAALREAAII